MQWRAVYSPHCTLKTTPMQLKFRLWPVLALAVFTTFSACKKDAKDSSDSDAQLTTHSNDQIEVSSEMDAVNNDADAVVEANAAFSGRVGDASITLCDGTVTTETSGNPLKMTITYNGASCSGVRTRTGSIVITMPAGTHWKDAGATLTINYQNLKITRTSDNKSITLNGTETVTNVSGGRLIDLISRGSITHTITSSNMSITFDGGAQRTWQVARKRVFTYNNGLIITISGTHTEGTVSNISEWGTTRFGGAFTTAITQPIVIRQDCNFRVTDGEIQHDRPIGSGTVLFGLDATGNPTSCPGTGSYYFKLSWTGVGGNVHSVILPY